MQTGLGGDGLPSGITQVGLMLRYGWFGDHVRGTAAIKPDPASSLETLMATLGARHHFGAGWAAELSVPLGTLNLDPGGGASPQRLSGFGDIALEGSYDLAALWGTRDSRPSLRLRLGLGLPTGAAGELGEGLEDVSPEIVSLGWGAFSLRVGVDLGWRPHQMVALTVPVAAYLPLNRNSDGKLFGEVLTYGLGLVLLPTDGLTIGLRLLGEHRGTIDEGRMGEVLSSGGDLLYTELSAGVAFDDSVHLGISARLPTFIDVNGQQLVESVMVAGALTLTFGMGGDDDDDDDDDHDHGADDGHGHDAHEGHDHASADMKDVATGGASFAIADALVPGKVTVIDFWASWCQPCHVITARLRELAAHDPRLAVRRVEAPDLEDTPVAKEHLQGASGLPVVWVYDPSGQRVATLTGTTPEAVVKAVEEALAKLPE